ncbi:uncharacterized protein LOC112340705 [Selaginella moellendorffii]|uniref:uncharacterized protein LOC112340705 n=1 Tax=Selaginella moellendorffii TaxID=88036 RepID=UPI000D1CABD5|nr:uncharacterized protein LOC112340705 [Selaginella moellendorffii]|eukprot:XP_024515318.1 uncharacterized protein LOC112340705 [Selaginella moellendorffii]
MTTSCTGWQSKVGRVWTWTTEELECGIWRALERRTMETRVVGTYRRGMMMNRAAAGEMLEMDCFCCVALRHRRYLLVPPVPLAAAAQLVDDHIRDKYWQNQKKGGARSHYRDRDSSQAGRENGYRLGLLVTCR